MSGLQEPHDGHRLEVRDLHVHYDGICALEKVGFEARCGEAVALLGRNGAGKSTLLKAVAGLVRPATGQINWRGVALANARHEVGYLPQRESVDWNFPITVRGMVEMGRFPHVGWFGRFGREDEREVDRAIELMELQSLQKRQISELSGGQQQRAFIARALAQQAHIFLLDEPFAGLDQPSQESLAATLNKLAATGHLVLASHHDLATAPQIFSRALLLDRVLVADGPVSDLIGMMRGAGDGCANGAGGAAKRNA